MHIEIENIENKSFISAYDKGYVSINNCKYSNYVFINNNRILQVEDGKNIFKNNFLINHIKNNFNTKLLDIILVGYNPIKLSKPTFLEKDFIQLEISYEIMESMAAYKTHNILTAENRKILSVIDIL